MLIDSYPKEALAKLEEVSYLLREGKDLSKFLLLEDSRDYRAQAADLAEYMEKFRSNKEKPKTGEEEEEVPAEEEVAPVGLVQDLMKDICLFAWAGVGFG